MDLFYKDDIQKLFEQLLNDIKCREDTKSYIVGVFAKYKTADLDYSKDSITLLFGEARYHRDFYKYQNLGDYILFANSLFPEFLTDADKKYYHDIAKLSYYSCYEIINRQWLLYQELADNYNEIESSVRSKLIVIR